MHAQISTSLAKITPSVAHQHKSAGAGVLSFRRRVTVDLTSKLPFAESFRQFRDILSAFQWKWEVVRRKSNPQNSETIARNA